MTILFTILNFALLVVVIIIICKAFQRFKDFIVRSKEVDKKIDTILGKLEGKK